MGHHRCRPTERQPPFGRDHRAAVADDEQLGRARFQMLLSRVENPLVECAGKALLGAQHDDDVSFLVFVSARLRLGFRCEGKRLTEVDSPEPFFTTELAS